MDNPFEEEQEGGTIRSGLSGLVSGALTLVPDMIALGEGAIRGIDNYSLGVENPFAKGMEDSLAGKFSGAIRSGMQTVGGSDGTDDAFRSGETAELFGAGLLGGTTKALAGKAAKEVAKGQLLKASGTAAKALVNEAVSSSRISSWLNTVTGDDYNTADKGIIGVAGLALAAKAKKKNGIC
jgi:hypothetical protein